MAKNDIATKETKKQPAPIKIEKEPYNFQLPNADNVKNQKSRCQKKLKELVFDLINK